MNTNMKLQYERKPKKFTIDPIFDIRVNVEFIHIASSMLGIWLGVGKTEIHRHM